MRTGAIFALAPFVICTIASGAHAAETPHIQFVREYIRELGELEGFRTADKADSKQNGANSLSDSIHWSTRTQIALRTDISMLSGIHLAAPNDALVSQMIGLSQQKIALHDELIAIATEFMSGPKPGVDYGKLAAEAPKVRAQLEALDNIYVKMSVVVFATLIDEKPDKNGQMSRLTIAAAERQDLLEQLQSAFGSTLDQKNPDDLVNAAWVLRAYLRKDKGYKCTDET
jgi:hypothetical protein